jgi:hypothetical protein
MASPDVIKMAEADADGDPGEVKQSPTHTRDSGDEYFEVEDIRSCKLGVKLLTEGIRQPSLIVVE